MACRRIGWIAVVYLITAMAFAHGATVGEPRPPGPRVAYCGLKGRFYQPRVHVSRHASALKGPLVDGPTDPGLTRFEFAEPQMGTQWKLTLYAADKATAEAAAKAAFARVAELELVMSDYTTKSEILKACAANDANPGKPLAVGDDLLRVLQHARAVGEASDGAFDPSISPVVKLWRNARRTKELPPAKDRTAALALVGLDKWKVDAKARTLTLSTAGVRLDFGGIGKGFAADEVLAVLKKQGVTRALVAASGDVTAGDAPPDSDGWVVDIAPLDPNDKPRKLKLANRSVSTSGDLFQSVEIEGVRYSHVVDPKTGLGQTGRRSATVVADRGWKADSLTKAALLLPPDKALKVVEGLDGVMFLAAKETETAEVKRTESKGFRAYQIEGKGR